jgi:hypothetical protein
MKPGSKGQLFLTTAYRKKRFIFWICCLFIVCQLAVSFTRGVFTPFYNYGMYSAVFTVKPAYPVLEIYSNGKLINYNHYTLHQWNRIVIAYDYAFNSSVNDSFYVQRIRPIMGMTGLQPDANFYTLDHSPAAKEKRAAAWKQMAEKILETKIDSFRIRNYTWNGSQLTTQ